MDKTNNPWEDGVYLDKICSLWFLKRKLPRINEEFQIQSFSLTPVYYTQTTKECEEKVS